MQRTLHISPSSTVTPLPPSARCGIAAGVIAGLAKPPVFAARFTHVLCAKDVMALVVDGLAEATPAGGGGQTGAEFVTQFAHAVRSRLHVTVGTRAGML